MSTTIRITNEDKTKLEKLQAELFLSTGRRLNFTDLLHYLIETGEKSLYNKIIDDTSSQNIDWKYLVQSVKDLGPTDVDEIDEIVYGE